MGLLDFLGLSSKPDAAPTAEPLNPIAFETHPATVEVIPPPAPVAIVPSEPPPAREEFVGMSPERLNQRLSRLREALDGASGAKHSEISVQINAIEAYKSRFINGG